jgi:hypothetical protein
VQESCSWPEVSGFLGLGIWASKSVAEHFSKFTSVVKVCDAPEEPSPVTASNYRQLAGGFRPAPEPPEKNGFNPRATIPFGVTTDHLYESMKDFTGFVEFVDTQLRAQEMARFEDILMAANFSSLVGEFMSRTIPKHCKTVVKNNRFNGHPDILPAGKYPHDSVRRAGIDGIEIRASRYLKSWQAHKAEDMWLMMFVFQSGRVNPKVTEQVGFKFLIVAGGLLTKADWPATRSETGHAMTEESVTTTAAQRMMSNWIYKCKELR